MKTERKEKKIRNLILFSMVVILLPWLGVFLDQGGGNPASEGLGILLWMAVPLMMTLILRTFFGAGWKDFGLKPNFKDNWKWYLFSLLFYPVSTLLVILIGGLLGGNQLSSISLSGLAISFLTALTGAFLKNLLVEEAAWRGFLAPKVLKLKLPRLVSHVIVGIIWALWHAPYYFIFEDISLLSTFTTQTPGQVFGLTIIGAIPAAIIYGEIRLRTNSFWPAVLMHTIGSALLVPMVQDGLLSLTPGREWLGSPGADGLIVTLFSLVVGLFLMQKNKQN